MNINFKNTLKCKYRYLVLFLWVEAREFAEKNEKMLRTWLYWKKKKKQLTLRNKTIPKNMGESFINR